MIQLRVQVRCSCTNWGESVAVVGSWASWDQDRFTVLTTDADIYPLWKGEIPLDSPLNNDVEYKYVVVKEGEIVKWECDGRGVNRKVTPREATVDDGVFGEITTAVAEERSEGRQNVRTGDTFSGNSEDEDDDDETLPDEGYFDEGEVDESRVDIILFDEHRELDEFEKSIIKVNAEKVSWRQRLSFVRSLFTNRERAKNYGFQKSYVPHLVTLFVYLTYLSAGHVRCEDNDGHHRPHYHALESRKLNVSLRELARSSDEDFLAYLIRRIYPSLPSFSPQFTASTPLSRIRNIAHRNDIPSSLKKEIKRDLQNKLHRCAGPEDLKTCERLLAKVTAPKASYSKDFVHQLKLFYKELLNFFNAAGLEDRLNNTAKGEIIGLSANAKDLSSKLYGMKRNRTQASNQLGCLTELRRALTQYVSHRSKPDIADADLQQLMLLDIALETYAFTLLAAAAAIAEKSIEENVSSSVECLALAMDNLQLSHLAVDRSCAVAAELRSSYSVLRRETERTLWLRFYAAVEQSLRYCEELSERVVELFASRVGALSVALRVAPPAAKVFAEAQIRAHCFFQASRISSALLIYLRRELNLPLWEALRPGKAMGTVKCVTSLGDIEECDENVIAVIDKAGGDEDIPPFITGVVLGHDLPSLSHLGVRARQAGVVFAGALDAIEFSNFAKQACALRNGQLVVSDDGQVRLSDSSDHDTHTDINRKDLKNDKSKAAKVGNANLKSNNVEALFEAKPDTCGSKCASAGPLASLSKDSKNSADFATPRGVAVSFKAFADARETQLDRYRDGIAKYRKYETGPAKDVQADQLRQMIETQFHVPDSLILSIQRQFTSKDTTVMVRSSANCEDLEGMSGAGLYESVANVNASRTKELTQAIRRVWGSLWSHRAARSRTTYGINHSAAYMGVLVQEMVLSELSFVAFSQNPISGNSAEIYIELVVGMGETLASARLRGSPLRAIVNKKQLEVDIKGFPSFGIGLFPSSSGGLKGVAIDYSKERITTDEEFRRILLTRIGKIAIFLERELGGPQDIEGAIVKKSIYIVQSRPMVCK